jgi:phosphoglucosamine mutase
VLTNVRYRKGAAPLDEASVQAAIIAGEAQMGARGRLVIRKSGTEPLVRIMGECEDPELLRSVVGAIEAEVARYA